MNKSTVAIVSGLAGAGILLLLLGLARRYAPDVIDSADQATALRVALESVIRQSTHQTSPILFVRSDDEQGLISELRRFYPNTRFEGFSKRPADDGCRSKDPQFVVIGPCERDDYVTAYALSYPLWRCAIISVGTFNSGGQLILVKVGGTWRVVSERYYAI